MMQALTDALLTATACFDLMLIFKQRMEHLIRLERLEKVHHHHKITHDAAQDVVGLLDVAAQTFELLADLQDVDEEEQTEHASNFVSKLTVC